MPYRSLGRRWGKVLGILGAAIMACSVAGCSPYPLSPIKPQGLVARQDDNLYEVVSVLSYAVFVIVGGLMIFASIYYRRRRNQTSEPRQIFGNSPLELTWTFIPIVIVALLFTLGVQTLQATAVPARTPKGALVIEVIGHQWYWEYKYDRLDDRPINGVDYQQNSDCHTYHNPTCLSDGLHLPVNTTAILKITGYDVQHGWWVPALAGKNEAIPGHVNIQQLVPEKTGTYYAICSYYCGIYHYNMRANVVVQSRAAFDAWLKAKQGEQSSVVAKNSKRSTPTQKIAQHISFSKDIEGIFSAHCAACHISQQLGGLNLSNYNGLVKGGNVVPGSIVKPGDHADSVLWKIVQPTPPWPGGNRMPLGGPYLSDSDIQTIAAWIDQGAKTN